MRTLRINMEKRTYSQPHLECIKLDNEIALALESYIPPVAPGETSSMAPEFLSNDPLISNF
ncbi:MAG: hypothetical protein NTY32_07330 [Bacteroidia bacterium]|nr:hypothetical protein [Bacteroidia bacterium]